MKANNLILLAAVLALLFGMAVKGLLSQGGRTDPTMLPDFSLNDLSGKPHAISQWQGQLRIINFWATWCPPCRKEIPELMALHKNYADRGVVVIGIAIDDPEAVADYLHETAINYPLLMAGDQGISLARQLGDTVDAVPFTVIVNKQGDIIYRHPGEFNQQEILTVISPLLN